MRRVSLKWIVLLCLLTVTARINAQEQPVFITDYNGKLYALDLFHCTARSIIDSIDLFEDIAFTPDGRLWGIVNENVGATLFQIDTATGQPVAIGPVAVYGNSLVALNDSTLLMEHNANLYGIRIRDASTYLIGHIGYPSEGDLTWYDNDLYMASEDNNLFNIGLLVKIVLNGAQDSILSAGPVNSADDPIPSCFGLATVFFPDSGPAIIGFSGKDAYKLNPSNGSYELLCPAIVPYNGISGAASLSQGPVAIEDTAAFQFRCYPIPATNRIYAELLHFRGKLSDVALCLYDAAGRLLLQQQLSTGKQEIKLTAYSKGIYYIRLFYNNSYLAGKAFVKK